MEKTKLVTVPTKIPEALVKELDLFVSRGFFTSRSEAIREAVKWFLIEEMKRLEPSYVYWTMLTKEMAGKIKPKSAGEIIEELREIRKKVWRE